MTETATALARLASALDRLERAAVQRPGTAVTEISGLRQDTDDLARRHAALKKSAGQVAARLDETIHRLATIVEKDGADLDG